ncbi:hypothetical protein NZD89_06015 [Alicyclobacillus fastidiosus]|uniref:Fibronectin type-III domain-containing protein n=1 Tax=Alicyclobacillus fastidiosus TaxID=392011 RepID=A0ABY6ZJL3_9BACL|nr:hypothetical protein [Alicyclobacillus fastidiosus]WAH42970.1 hypothetical protein NZD89_06015 [Alicyclobacillus fastidiosus]GMA64937.1 hypothetical protein GCM10025859_53770 [Alicyclobacillus fastidiosus]
MPNQYGLYPISKGAIPQSSDLNQILQGFLGQLDMGALSFLKPLSAPGAPTVALNGAGNLTGTYGYVVTYCTGIVQSNGTLNIIGETLAGTVSSSVSPKSQQVMLSNIPTGPTGTVARRIYRNQSSGSASNGPFLLLATIPDNTTTTFPDNVPDSNLGADAPVVNTKGTQFTTLYAAAGVNILGLTAPTNVQATQSTVANEGLVEGVTYYFWVTSLDYQGGETTVGNMASYTLNSSNGNYGIHISWDDVPGATQYKIYINSNDTNPQTGGLLATVSGSTNDYDWDGAPSTSGTPPTTNTTGFVTANGGMTAHNGATVWDDSNRGFDVYIPILAPITPATTTSTSWSDISGSYFEVTSDFIGYKAALFEAVAWNSTSGDQAQVAIRDGNNNVICSFHTTNTYGTIIRTPFTPTIGTQCPLQLNREAHATLPKPRLFLCTNERGENVILYYAEDGTIVAASSGGQPNDADTSFRPQGAISVLYLSDTEYADVYANSMRYKIINGEPVRINECSLEHPLLDVLMEFCLSVAKVTTLNCKPISRQEARHIQSRHADKEAGHFLNRITCCLLLISSHFLQTLVLR